MANNDNLGVQQRRIAIIDDDLAPLKYAALSEELRNVLADPNSPEFEAIWGFALTQGAVEETDDAIIRAERVCSNDFVSSVLLEQPLAQALPDIYEQYIEPDVALKNRRLEWHRCVQECFTDNTYEVVQHDIRPDPAEVADCHGIILDLVMEDGEPFESVVGFLERLYSAYHGDDNEPPSVILISRTVEALERHRNAFRSRGKVSASALRLVDKADLSAGQQGVERFRLLWAQMEDERSLSQKLSAFGHALDDGLKASCSLVNEAYWNLDGDALLRIYKTCIAEGDVFGDHVLELLCRDLVWHLREDANVQSGVDAIEKAMKERFSTKAGTPLRRFYVSNEEDGEAFRKLIHHYHWLPSGPPQLLRDVQIHELKKQLARWLPFGAVLAKDTLDIGVDVYVHLTQPCDLLRFGDKSDSKRFKTDSLQFSTGQLATYQPDVTGVNQRHAVIPGLSHTDRFNLDVDFKRPVSRPASSMISSLRQSGYSVVGVLRPEVAQSVSIGQQNYSGRPAAPAFLDILTESFRLEFQLGASVIDLVRDDGGIGFPTLVEFEQKAYRRIIFLGDGPQIVAATCCNDLASRNVSAIEIGVLAEALRDGIYVKDGGTAKLCDTFEVLSCRGLNNAEITRKRGSNPQQGVARLIILPPTEATD